jgi:hypothetical protein
MVQLLKLLCGALIGLFQSSARREAEILVLRQQINVLRSMSPKRPALNNADRLLFVWLSRLVPTTVCTENSIRVDHVSESPNVGDDDCAVLPLPGLVRLAVQVEEPT